MGPSSRLGQGADDLGQGADDLYGEIKTRIEKKVGSGYRLENKSVTINYVLAGRNVTTKLKGKNLTDIDSCIDAFKTKFEPKGKQAINNNGGHNVNVQLTRITIQKTESAGFIDKLASKAAGQAMKILEEMRGSKSKKEQSHKGIEDESPKLSQTGQGSSWTPINEKSSSSNQMGTQIGASRAGPAKNKTTFGFVKKMKEGVADHLEIGKNRDSVVPQAKGENFLNDGDENIKSFLGENKELFDELRGGAKRPLNEDELKIVKSFVNLVLKGAAEGVDPADHQFAEKLLTDLALTDDPIGKRIGQEEKVVLADVLVSLNGGRYDEAVENLQKFMPPKDW